MFRFGPLPLLLALGVCNRSPHEIAPMSSGTASASVESSRLAAPIASRCVHATPDAPPPPVEPAVHCPRDPLGSPPKADQVDLHFPSATLHAEVARSAAETERGLMFRTSLPEDHGMIFILAPHEDHTFWMHNTCNPLDMLFVEDDGTIVGILENVPTLNDDPRSVGCPSSFVIETDAGWCRKHGVRAGQKVTLPKL